MPRKKTFVNADDPALSFISQESVEQAEESRPQSDASPREQPPKGYKRNPEFVEVKSRRVQLVMQPSLYEKVKRRSEEEGISFNEYCHRVLEAVCDRSSRS